MAAITKRAVDAAKPAAKDSFIWDDEVRGFGLKVTSGGGKTYVYQYRIARPGEAERTAPKRFTIGRHGNLTPEQARKRAKELAALVEQGIDPRQRDLDAAAAKEQARSEAEERARQEGELAFRRYADLWLDHYENEKGRRPKSVELAKVAVNRYLKPALKEKPMPHIGRANIQPIIDAIPVRRRATRRAVFAYASVLFGWAAKRGDIEGNPLVDMAKPEAPDARDRVLNDGELAEVWKASGKLDAPFGQFFRLLILTGQRRSEVAAMSWDELDHATETWTIPAGRAKNGVAHIVPLSDAVVAELDSLAEAACQGKSSAEPGCWPKAGPILTTNRRTPIGSFSKAKRSLDTAIANARRGDEGKGEQQDHYVTDEGTPEVEAIPEWRVHDLRRTLATGFQRLGIRFEVTEAVLNHVSGAKGGIAGIYQRHDWKKEKRSALDAWARHVATIIAPTEQGNVVPLDAAKKSA